MVGPAYDKVAVKRIRKELQQKIRNDWDQVLKQALSNGVGKDDQNMSSPPQEAVEWRERNYASSDPSSDTSSEEDSDVPYSKLWRLNAKRKVQSLQGETSKPFASHHCMHPDGSDVDGDTSPSTDSPAEAIPDEARKKMDRKRRRRKRLEEEMTWNEGLRNWQRNRDIWCRARRTPTNEEASSSSSLETWSTATTNATSATSATSTSVSIVQPPTNAKQDSANSPTTFSPSTQSTKSPTTPSRRKPSPAQMSTTTLLPVPKPIIPPTDPARRDMVVQYPLIYSKIVVDGIVPQIPVNLSHLVPALVQGWKANDEWPPKPSTADAFNISRTSSSRQSGQPIGSTFMPVLGPNSRRASQRRSRADGGRDSLVIETGKKLFNAASGRKASGNASPGASPSSPSSSKVSGAPDDKDKDKDKDGGSPLRKQVAKWGLALKGFGAEKG